jgi:hypothetical protein
MLEEVMLLVVRPMRGPDLGGSPAVAVVADRVSVNTVRLEAEHDDRVQ